MVGAGLAYFYDPNLGNRRRALVRHQFHRLVNRVGDAFDVTLRDIKNRSYGTFSEVRSAVTSDEPSDRVLADRVRSEIGRYISHPRAIEVEAIAGVVVLSGPILADEADNLLSAVQSVRGVEQVEDNLDIHETPVDVAALQGGRRRNGEPRELMQSYWSPTTRATAGAAGLAVMLACAGRPTPTRCLASTAGLGLLLRALSNLETKRLLGLHPRNHIGQNRENQRHTAIRGWQLV